MVGGTHSQRLDHLEAEVVSLKTTITEDVTNAVSDVARRVQQLAVNLERMTSQFKEDLKETTNQLGGRIDQGREQHDSMVAQLKQDQEKFQSEIRGTVESVRHLNRETHGENGGGGGGEFNWSRERGSQFLGDGGEGGRDSGGGVHGGPGRASWRYRKLDLPTFDGTNPDGWILRAERYFKFHHLDEEDKVEAAVVALEGDALLWF